MSFRIIYENKPLSTLICLKPTCICDTCGERFQHKKHRGWFIKTILFFADIRKYYCEHCKKTYYVFNGIHIKDDKLMGNR